MAKNNNLGDFIKSLADKFRSKLSTTAKINPQDFESKVDEVYSQGKQEEYDAFWDAFQKNGNRRNYSYAFFDGWTNANFAPKYDIIAEFGYSSYMFSQSNISGSLKTILNNQGVTLSFVQPNGKAYGAGSFFYLCSFTELPVLDFSMASGSSALSDTFGNSRNLEIIEKIILPDNCIGYGTNTFRGCRKLETIGFEGTIKYSLDFKDCPLTADSVNNILNCLDTVAYNGTRTITLKTASKTAYNDKYSNWDERVAQLTSSGNWTFTLV